MHIKQLTHGGWENNLQLSNDHVELIVSLDVGPRILSYRTPRGENVLKTYSDQLGQSGESEWMIRGGHRFWIAPENNALTYALDNIPVIHDLSEPNSVRLENAPVAPWNIKKEMHISLTPDSSEVTILHRATNKGSQPVTIATWGLTVMVPDGLEIIPLPALGEHPRDLGPDRVIVPWPYTDLSDSRWRFGWRFITVRQTPYGGPAKIGLTHLQKWVAYLMKNDLFIKTIDYEKTATYPDLGCNFETFTDADMLEIESLSPLRQLAPDESVSHIERWYLLGEIPQPTSLKERDLALWLEPLLKKVNLEITI